ncbi:outer membrane protein assembly factor BamA [Sphingosinithalassobacter sp. CS137]|uniref:outer membrane protein assembly factor BamA n=1 Tax=Sphingosinithalassobacter sp. CS137 TaxID=2762748 RepID=UPI00165DCB2F|nr:outer membrane protein assembly factor BamA [Sphingosinithalassobacter sp. CS137]
MVTAIKASNFGARATGTLLAGSMLAGLVIAVPALAQEASAPQQAPAPAQAPVAAPQEEQRVIRSLQVEGAQRIERETVLSYTQLRVGQPYTNETLDQAIVDLYASDLLADVTIAGAETGDIVIRIRENPIINRVLLEGNKRLKDDKITPEIRLAPRQIFTRTAVRADVARIVELYRRQGRFAAVVEPQMVMLDQNRVDVVFEIREGPKSKVRQINIIGNEQFSDGELRGEMATKQSRLWTIFSSNTSYDQDRLAYDQQKLRQFYLTQGYADFRVISAVAELTPDNRDFIITYVVEEGERYKFGDVTVDSAIRDFNDQALAASLPFREGDWYDAKKVEDAVDQLSEMAGLYGYAFADVRPEFQRNREDLTMGINFNVAEANRTYIERIEITGNTQTQDEVIRREFRVAEGDAFNTFLVKRSQDRINSLGYFQEGFEIEQREGSSPDRIILAANVEEKATGELTLSAGFSSLERFILQGSIRQRNFRGKGQTLSASLSYSSYSKSAELGFTEPYLFDRNIALGGTIFRRDYNAFNYVGNDRETTYSQVSTGFQLVTGVPLTEFWTLSGRYTLTYDDVFLDSSFNDAQGNCDPARAGRYYCEAVGERLTSMIGVSVIHDSLNSRIRPSRGNRLVLGLDFAGLGGDVRYLRGRAEFDKYWDVGSGFIFSVGAEGGYIHSLEESPGPGIDPVRITDRFYLGEPQFRGFDIRGVGPRVQRIPYTGDPTTGTQLLVTDEDRIIDDAIGGKAYYLAKAELEIPLGSGARELGLRPSVFVQAGALFDITEPLRTVAFPRATDAAGNPLTNADGSPTLLPSPQLDDAGNQLYVNSYTTSSGVLASRLTTCSIGYAASASEPCSGTAVNPTAPGTAPFFERFVGNSAMPRLSVGVGVNWNSPFGPLRIDVAKALITEEGDDPKLFTFNVGTQF